MVTSLIWSLCFHHHLVLYDTPSIHLLFLPLYSWYSNNPSRLPKNNVPNISITIQEIPAVIIENSSLLSSLPNSLGSLMDDLQYACVRNLFTQLSLIYERPLPRIAESIEFVSEFKHLRQGQSRDILNSKPSARSILKDYIRYFFALS
jgi:hypothetical protein